MLAEKPIKNVNIALQNSPYINTTLGLKHLNDNDTLYVKILKSFAKRYKELQPHTLKEEELSRTLHTVKGLTATLGMESLTAIIEQLENNTTLPLLSDFSQQLEIVVIEIENLT